MNLRLARNKDSEQIIKLIRKCFKDYQNCFLDVDNDSPELKYIYSYFRRQRGKFWVVEDKNKIIVQLDIKYLITNSALLLTFK